MKGEWIRQSNGSQLIIFFNGWSMDSNALRGFEHTPYDVYMLSSYHTLEHTFPNVDGYQRVYVVAWSLGVWAASNTPHLSQIPLAKRIAINGTEMPVCSSNGIPPEVFEGTAKGWNESTRQRFNMRVAGGRNALNELAHLFSNGSVENQQQELTAIAMQYKGGKRATQQWDTAIVGDSDAIFAPANQNRYWEDRAQIINIKMPHIPFGALRGWDQIVRLCK